MMIQKSSTSSKELHLFDVNSLLLDCFMGSNGKIYKTDWKGLKDRSLLLADSFDRLGFDGQASTVRSCARYLEFLVPVSNLSLAPGQEPERIRLHNAILCRNRLCPICMKRRQMKIFGQASKVLNKAASMENISFLFLTLTHPNCYGHELPDVLDLMFSACTNMLRRKPCKRAFIGSYRALEVLFDPMEIITTDMYWGNPKLHMKSRKAYYDKLGLSVGFENPNFMKVHPHFHLILAVNDDYFTGPNYLSQEEISAMWAENLGVSGQYRQVYIEKVKLDQSAEGKSLADTVSEVAKYPIKDFDILIPGREDLTDYAVNHLYSSLHGRRMVSYGGLLKKIHKDLNLSDPIDGDLIHVDDQEQLREDVEYMIARYSWRVGATTGFDYYLDGLESVVNLDVE